MHPLTSGIRLDKCFRVKTKEPGLLCEYKKIHFGSFFLPKYRTSRQFREFFFMKNSDIQHMDDVHTLY